MIFMLISEGVKLNLYVVLSKKLAVVNYFLLVFNCFDNLEILNEMSLVFL